jgi:hypothetical protein
MFSRRGRQLSYNPEGCRRETTLIRPSAQAGVLTAEAKIKLAGELTAFHAEYSGVLKTGCTSSSRSTRRAAASRQGRRRHGSAGAPHPNRPVTGLQARLADAPLETATSCDQCARRPDRHRHSGGARQPSHGNGEDYAGRRRPVTPRPGCASWIRRRIRFSPPNDRATPPAERFPQSALHPRIKPCSVRAMGSYQTVCSS